MQHHVSCSFARTFKILWMCAQATTNNTVEYAYAECVRDFFLLLRVIHYFTYWLRRDKLNLAESTST